MNNMISSSPDNQDVGYEFNVYASYKLSKIKEKISDCQDSFGFSDNKLRIAISDGATQSFYSGLWADILCKSYCSWLKPFSPQCWTEWFNLAQLEWIEKVNEKLNALKEAGKPSWIECLNGLEMKKDAFATFIGICIEDLYINGIIIGDSRALLVKQNLINNNEEKQHNSTSIVRAFPGLWQHSFSNNTVGLSSYAKSSFHLPEFFNVPVPQDGESYLILLMTDALAEYTIEKEREGHSIIDNLLSLKTSEQFFDYVSAARNGGLANDDTTLVVAGITSKMPSATSQGISSSTCGIESEMPMLGISEAVSSDIEENSVFPQPCISTALAIATHPPRDDVSKNQDLSSFDSSDSFLDQQNPISAAGGENRLDDQKSINLSNDYGCNQDSYTIEPANSASSTHLSIDDSQSESLSVRSPITHSEVSLPINPKKKINSSSSKTQLKTVIQNILSILLKKD